MVSLNRLYWRRVYAMKAVKDNGLHTPPNQIEAALIDVPQFRLWRIFRINMSVTFHFFISQSVVSPLWISATI